MVQEDDMMGECVLTVFTLEDDALLLRATIGGAGVSTLSSSGSSTLCAGDICTTLGGETGLFRRAGNKVESFIRATNWVSSMC